MKDGELIAERYLSATVRPVKSLLDSIEYIRDFEVKGKSKEETDEVKRILQESKIAVLELGVLE